MSSANRGRARRQERDRARLYQARAEHHASIGRRRRRDDILALTVGTLLVAGAIASQAVYYGSGPGAPAPAPTGTAEPTPSSQPSLAPTLAPEPTTTPTPTPSP